MAAKQGERTRRRLSTEERREQLLAVGARLFSESPYDDVWIEQVAEIAGVSRGLLYHYFPTKRDFFAAVVERESERMLRMTARRPRRRRRASSSPPASTPSWSTSRSTRTASAPSTGPTRPATRPCARSTSGRWPRRSAQILAALAADPEFGRLLDGACRRLRLAVRGLAGVHDGGLPGVAARVRSLSREQVRDLCARALFGVIAA